VPEVPIECDDGAFCSGQEWCDPAVGCRAGFPAAFDDDPCTTDSCDEATATLSHVASVAPVTPDAGELPATSSSLSDAGVDAASIDFTSEYQCADLCDTAGQIYVASATENVTGYNAYYHVELADVGCDTSFAHCGRTPNGEVYVSDDHGDPLTLPVSDGCAVNRWFEKTFHGPSFYFMHHVEKCCIGEFPFVDGEPIGTFSYIVL
jgi:hypothetical protein